MMDAQQWWGDLPTWITTAAVAIAVLQFMADRRRRRAEEDRESKVQATGLTSWVTTNDARDFYGVVIANTSGATFHDVVIEVALKGFPSARPITLRILPPGTYLVRHKSSGDPFEWAFARDLREAGQPLQPFMNTAEWAVTAIRFSDNLGQRWTADERAILTREA